MASISIVVANVQDLENIAIEATKLGFVLERKLQEIGALTGQMASEDIDNLRQLPGVQAVEIQRELTIAPPKSPVQ